jgi:hypothetical protein
VQLDHLAGSEASENGNILLDVVLAVVGSAWVVLLSLISACRGGNASASSEMHVGDGSVTVAQVLEDQCHLESSPPLGTIIGVLDHHCGGTCTQSILR